MYSWVFWISSKYQYRNREIEELLYGYSVRTNLDEFSKIPHMLDKYNRYKTNIRMVRKKTAKLQRLINEKDENSADKNEISSQSLVKEIIQNYEEKNAVNDETRRVT